MVVAWFKRKLAEASTPPAPARPRGRGPQGRRIYAIGDIHGRIDLLTELQGKIQSDAASHPDQQPMVIYLGDYVDRGMDSFGVIELLLKHPLPGFDVVHLMGNHEDQLLSFLNGDLTHGFGWMRQGGRECLESYGVMAPNWGDDEHLARAQQVFTASFPDAHREFLRGLKLRHEEGDYLFVHAGVRPGTPLAAQSAQDMMWIRGEFLTYQRDFGKIVVHGHSINMRPDVQLNRIGIDTGAYATGVLTALVIDGTDWHFLQTGTPDQIANIA